MTVSPTYSVVITAHNAAASIGSSLTSVARQKGLADGALEILLVDDRSIDGTSDEAAALGLANLRIIRVDRPSAGDLTTRQDALTLGFRAAKGDIILTLDADGLAEPDWVANMSAPILASRADAVSGPVAFRAETGMLGMWQTVDVADYLATNLMLTRFGFRGGALFGNFAFRRALFDEIGGFDRIGFTLTEDLALSRALQDNGARLTYSAKGTVEVAACDSWMALIERAKRVSAGGISALSITVGVRMALLPILGVLALIFGGIFTLLFLLRYILGVLFVEWSLLRIGKVWLLPLSFLFEPLAIIIGLAVMWRLRRSAEVEWGGKKYAR